MLTETKPWAVQSRKHGKAGASEVERKGSEIEHQKYAEGLHGVM